MKEARWVKELQKKASVKKYILQNFPKPIIHQPKLKFRTGNSNPSLLGNTIEFFYYLSLSNDLELKDHFKLIERAIRRYMKITKEKMILHRKYAEIILPEEKYSRFLKIFNLKTTHLKPFPCLEINGEDWNISKTCKAKEELDIILFIVDFWNVNNIKIEKIFIFSNPDFDIFINNLYSDFAKEFSVYRVHRKMTISIISKLIFLTYLGNQWSTISISNTFFLERDFILQLKKILISINKNINSTTIFFNKPSLKIENIFATPDFIIKNNIVEIKATKAFFSTADYVQIMLYLLFSSHKSNIEYYGKIRKAIIEYPLFEKSVEIENPFNSKNSTKHLQEIFKLAK